MLLAALQNRTATARISVRTARTLSASPLRSPAANWDQPYRLRAVATQATAETATMPGIRTVKHVRLPLVCLVPQPPSASP